MQNKTWVARTAAMTAVFATLATGHFGGVAFAADKPAAKSGNVNWSGFEGGPSAPQYSPLKQINKANVSQLQKAFYYPAGHNGFRFGSNPLVIDGVMFVIGQYESLDAIDATNGKLVWSWKPEKPRKVQNRGVAYWASKDGKDQRVYYAVNELMYAIDIKTGQPVASFGTGGHIDLRENLGRPVEQVATIESGSPGQVFENMIIMGSAPGEGYGSAPGDIRAYDVLSGKILWSFHTVPHPGEVGYDTWPKDAWKYIGGVNNWGGLSIDTKRGVVYVPLGSPTYDFYGADRKGNNLFSDCVLAIDARTGKYKWHYQIVHHDLWDYDLTTSPKLVTIKKDGKSVDVVAQAGKTGFLYVLDRDTGKPIWPIEEKPVPKSDMPGEETSATQPFPTWPKPFARQEFKLEDVNPYIKDPKELEDVKKLLRETRNGFFMPPSTVNVIHPAGNSGGSNWGSSASDPTKGWVYVLSKDAPTMLKLSTKPPKREIPGPPAVKGHALYIQNCQVCHTAAMTGQPPAIPSLVGVVDRAGVDRIKNIVHTGQAPMPPFPDLEDKDIDNIIAFLREPAAGKIPDAMMALLNNPAQTTKKLDDGTTEQYFTGYGYMNTSDGLPMIGPPWSNLTAYDLNTGEIKFQAKTGGVKSLEKRGIKEETGSFWPRGGPTATAGGLVFLGTKSDGKLWAYDSDTGKVLWSAQTDGAPEGIPSVYSVNGQEYVAFSASPASAGGGDDASIAGAAPKDPNNPDGQGYYVYALPKK